MRACSPGDGAGISGIRAVQFVDRAVDRARCERCWGLASHYQVLGLVEGRYSRIGRLPGGFRDGVQGLVLGGRDQTELVV